MLDDPSSRERKDSSNKSCKRLKFNFKEMNYFEASSVRNFREASLQMNCNLICPKKTTLSSEIEQTLTMIMHRSKRKKPGGKQGAILLLR